MKKQLITITLGLGLLGGMTSAVPAAAKGPVKVFILSGQSNMQGKAAADTLDAVIGDPKTRDEFKHLKKDGEWVKRGDVWVTFLDNPGRGGFPTHGPLTVGYGSDYRKVLSETKKVLDDMKTYFPDYDPEQGYEIAGFIWFQGWNDAIGEGNPDYVAQMAHFIRDVRKGLKAPKMPFVIGELGTDGPGAEGWVATFRKQQAEIAALEEFKGTVKLAKTAGFWPSNNADMQDKWNAFRAAGKVNEAKPKDDPTRVDPGDFFNTNWVQKYKKELSFTSDKRYHYLGSGACYYRMGESMGTAMVELLN